MGSIQLKKDAPYAIITIPKSDQEKRIYYLDEIKSLKTEIETLKTQIEKMKLSDFIVTNYLTFYCFYRGRKANLIECSEILRKGSCNGCNERESSLIKIGVINKKR